MSAQNLKRLEKDVKKCKFHRLTAIVKEYFTNPCPIFNGVLTKSPLNLWYRWEIYPILFYGYNYIPCPKITAGVVNLTK